MRVSRQQAEHNRGRILQSAARLFRERGYESVGIDAVMAAAGMTHGGFYGHFASKELLLAQALRDAWDVAVAQWHDVAASAGDPVAAIAVNFLSPEHRDVAAQGCPVAALGPEIARRSPAVRRVAADGIERQVRVLARYMPRDQALAVYAQMVGALLVARTVAEDSALSEEFLQATLQAVLGRAPRSAR